MPYHTRYLDTYPDNMKNIILFNNNRFLPVANGEVQVNHSEVDFRPSFVKVLAVDVDRATKPPEPCPARKWKIRRRWRWRRRWRNKVKVAAKLQNNGLAHMLPETDDLTLNNMSASSLCDERNSEAVVISSGVVENVKEEDKSAGNSHNLLSRIHVSSRKKLLILDLNGLLVDIVSPSPKECKADRRIAGRAVFKRPFYCDFLKFCFERFEVGMWSSRSKKIMERVVDYLLGDMKQKLLFCWDLSHCTATQFRTLENKHKTLVFKELRRIWEKHDPNLPWQKGEYNESNTLLLDDSPYKALINPAHTAVFPYSFKFQDRSDSFLGAEGNLRVYLEELSDAEDVQKFVEQHPFGQKPITESSESWSFYLKVISELYSLPTTM